MSYIVICALAGAFWAAVITQSEGPNGVFAKSFQRWGKPWSCPFCMMFWLSFALVVVGTQLPPAVWLLVEASAAAGIGALVHSFYGVLTL